LLGHKQTLAYEPWPVADAVFLKDDTVEVPVQVNGKLRGKIVVSAEADAAAVEQSARADEKIAELLTGKTVAKVIVVPGKLVNFVVK
jgi:leucyl-tRNA synthetase